MSRPTRRLVSLRRPVADSARERYDVLWSALQTTITAAGAHAWRFVARDDPRLHLEFLEFTDDADPRVSAAASELLGRLATEAGAAEAEEWTER